MHYGYEQLAWERLGDSTWERAFVTLAEGDTAWNPASTKPERCVYGPGKVVYERGPDGGVRAILLDPDPLVRSRVDRTRTCANCETFHALHGDTLCGTCRDAADRGDLS